MSTKNILIVGCNGSIAKEISKSLKANNTTLYGISHSSHTEDNSIKYFYKCDITNPEAVQLCCKNIMNNCEQLDGIVYCAGVTIPNAINNMSIEDWNLSININLRGYFLIIKYLYPLIIKSPGCSIVQINSKTGKKGSYKNSAYASSKFGGIGLTQSLALELVEYGVRVNAVCPGNVYESKTWTDNLFESYSRTQNITPEQVREKYTDLVPMKRSCSYQDIINMVEYLLSSKSSYMTGQSINITGGQQLF